MENKYLVQLKGISENKNCWRTIAVFNHLNEAKKLYNFYKAGCCKRILRERIIKKIKVVRYEKY